MQLLNRVVGVTKITAIVRCGATYLYIYIRIIEWEFTDSPAGAASTFRLVFALVVLQYSIREAAGSSNCQKAIKWLYEGNLQQQKKYGFIIL